MFSVSCINIDFISNCCTAKIYFLPEPLLWHSHSQYSWTLFFRCIFNWMMFILNLKASYHKNGRIIIITRNNNLLRINFESLEYLKVALSIHFNHFINIVKHSMVLLQFYIQCKGIRWNIFCFGFFDFIYREALYKCRLVMIFTFISHSLARLTYS